MLIVKLKREDFIKPGYIDKKSCACCEHNILQQNISWFLDDRYCDIDNHKINYIESFSITCNKQRMKKQ